MSSPETPADLARIIELDRAVRDADAAIDAAKGVVGELQQRVGKLQIRLRDLNAVRPADTADLAAGMVDALAADPSASPDPKAMERAIELQAATRTKFDEWQVSVNLTEQAIAKVDRDILSAEDAVQDAVELRVPIWEDFVAATQSYLVEEFRASFLRLRSDFIEPLLAFSDSLASPSLLKIDRASFVTLQEFFDGRYHKEKLLELPPRVMSQRDCEPYIERFRATLSKMA